MTPPIHHCGIQLHQRIHSTSVRHMLRKQLLQKQNKRCYWCQRRIGIWWTKNHKTTSLKRRNILNTEIDHIIPRCAGGSNSPTNLVAACQECNRIRGFLFMRSVSFFNIIGQEPQSAILQRYKLKFSSNHATRQKYAATADKSNNQSGNTQREIVLGSESIK